MAGQSLHSSPELKPVASHDLTDRMSSSHSNNHDLLDHDHDHDHELSSMGTAAKPDAATATKGGAAVASGVPALGDANHPRRNMVEWKWKAFVSIIFMTSMINGYDVSNVANIQPRLYEAFGNIELLPWIALSYSLANFAVLSFARKIIIALEHRWIYLSNLIVFMAGAAIAGAAPNMTGVIVGRIIMGVGGSVIQQTNLSYMAVFSTSVEMPRLIALMTTCWAIGLVVGGPIGSAFAANAGATWRWAFYLNLPLVGICLAVAIISCPRHTFAAPGVPLLRRLLDIDPVGILFNIAAPVLFSIALTFSGPIWSWSSSGTIAVWVVFAIVLVSWIVQQVFCVFTTPEQRAIPVHILHRTDLLPVWVASGCAGASYAIILYYTPLYFAFVKGESELGQTVQLLPFILVFIFTVLFTGGALPAVGRYNLFFIFAGAATLSGSAAMAATLDVGVSNAQILGLEALLGIGLGMQFQHGLGICSAINKHSARDKVDAVVVCNMSQMGAIAVVLAAAGAVYQNVGFNLLVEALDGKDYADSDIREALAGVSSVVWQTRDQEVIRRGVEAVAKVLAREFWFVAAGGALCLVCGLLMRREKLDYGRQAKPATSSSADEAASTA